MSRNDDTSDAANRRSVLKTLGAGALASTMVGGVVSADKLSADGGSAADIPCYDETWETRCVNSACDCGDCGCECDTIEQERRCCRDGQGYYFCEAWISTGDCCSSC